MKQAWAASAAILATIVRLLDTDRQRAIQLARGLRLVLRLASMRLSCDLLIEHRDRTYFNGLLDGWRTGIVHTMSPV